MTWLIINSGFKFRSIGRASEAVAGFPYGCGDAFRFGCWFPHSCLSSSLAGIFRSLPQIQSGSKQLAESEETTAKGSLPKAKEMLLKFQSCFSKSTQKFMAYEADSMTNIDGWNNPFYVMRQRFLSFKNNKYMKELEHFQSLAEIQSPKFMVIGCADSRVCPSNILGFQPGEAFTIRNIANLVPTVTSGPSECIAALEFAVTALKVENILVIGHSRCAGIENLMRMQDDFVCRSFVNKWLMNGKAAKLKTLASAGNFSFDHQCRFCEKESINQSLLNLLTYPWIEDKVKNELVSLHGGYYNFTNCTFEIWTLDIEGCNTQPEGRKYAVKDKDFWS